MDVPANSHLADRLHAQGMRLTGQRALLLDIIESAPGHLDAQELWRLARARDPQINLSTVYRTVALLRDFGLVDEVHLAEDHHHYEAGDPAGHQHMICLGCGQVVEFVSPLVEQLAASLETAYAFDVSDVRVDVTGYCPACRAAARAGEASATPPPGGSRAAGANS